VRASHECVTAVWQKGEHASCTDDFCVLQGRMVQFVFVAIIYATARQTQAACPSVVVFVRLTLALSQNSAQNQKMDSPRTEINFHTYVQNETGVGKNGEKTDIFDQAGNNRR